ncbi:MAG TPA: hypothetical protein VK178_03060 [Opitutaceae bacterium]|nr:hypothetical protein [Opitutaceae bacterium]
MGPALSNNEILETLRELAAGVATPLWLFGGVAVDLLVGHWTRPHSDIDLNALASDRDQLTAELHQLGYRTTDHGWLTQWIRPSDGRRLEIVFLEQNEAGGIELVIRPGDPIGIPGRHPMVAGYLDATRFATLAGVTFRVSSPEGEWLARATGRDIVGNRAADPKLAHDQRLLEQLIPPAQLDQLRATLPALRAT